jgi:hypothetical protein
VRSALATLPWVESRTIEASRETKTARFGINDKRQFSMDEIRKVLPSRYRSGLQLVSGPE